MGPYTAGAIASIAYQQAQPVVDGNVVRVMARLLAWQKADVKHPRTLKRCWELAAELVDRKQPGDFNQVRA